MPLRGLAPALQEPLLTDTASKKPAISRATTSDRMAKTFAAAADAVSGEQSLPGQQNLNLNAFWTASLPFINMAIAFLNWLTPYVASAWTHLYSLYVAAPSRTLKMIFGAALCGFGGTFTASIAAIEAFRSLGGAQVYEALEVVAADVRAIGAASAADDAVDADNDGMPDVARTKPHELAQRKLAVAMTSIKEPGKLTEAIARLWACYLAILATMRMQFAQTTAIALGVVETFEYPLARLLAPGMAKLLGAGLAHWSETLLLSAVRLLAIVLAWYLQMILSAFYSALRGGQLFAEGLCDLIIANGWSGHVEALPFVAAPFDPQTTHLDEAVGYTLAALGFSYQLLAGFTLPFPLNIALLPLEIVEWLLRWQVTFAGSAASSDVAGGATVASG